MHNPTPRPRAPIGLIASAVLAVVGLILVLILIGWYVVQLVADAHPVLADMLGIAAAVGLVAIVLAGPAIGLLTVYRRWARVASIDAYHETRQIQARVQIAPLAQTFHHHIETTSQGAEQQLLSAPIEVVKPLAEWLDWIDEQPHALLGGKTKAGKTWLATALLEQRLKAGETVFILDPHSSGWLGLPTAGSAARDGEMGRALGAVLAEYIRRMTLRDEHKKTTGQELPHDYFGRMTVLIDEANEIADQYGPQWKTIIKQLASGSRKIGLSLLILGQSALVEDLMISGAMRENFARIGLDPYTVQALIDSERDGERKKALRAALVGMDRPAAAQINAQVWLLDRRGMAPGTAPAGARDLVWNGWDFTRGVAAQTPQAHAQELVRMPALLPVAIGSVKLSWVIAYMLKRQRPADEITAIVASLAARVAPSIPRDMLEAAAAQRVAAIGNSGNAALIAEQLDRDTLITACVQIGAGVSPAAQIWGGNRNQFYARAKQVAGVDT